MSCVGATNFFPVPRSNCFSLRPSRHSCVLCVNCSNRCTKTRNILDITSPSSWRIGAFLYRYASCVIHTAGTLRKFSLRLQRSSSLVWPRTHNYRGQSWSKSHSRTGTPYGVTNTECEVHKYTTPSGPQALRLGCVSTPTITMTLSHRFIGRAAGRTKECEPSSVQASCSSGASIEAGAEYVYTSVQVLHMY